MGAKAVGQQPNIHALCRVVLVIVFGAVLASAEDKLPSDVDGAYESLKCRDGELTELTLNTTVTCTATKDMPRVFCYTAPQFNIWRAFSELSFEVASLDAHKGGVIPFVHSVSADSLHGLIDKHVQVDNSVIFVPCYCDD
jgi:hypothetical protein